jgi:cysteine desulfurase / selenocysteine lyase
MLARRLASKGANISVSTQEYAPLDLRRRALPARARASVHYFNTEAEIQRFCEIVSDT